MSTATRAEEPTRLPEMTEKCKGCLGEGVYMGDGGAGGTCGICNGSGQMPLAAPPAITQGHLEIFRQAEVTSFTKRDAVFAHERMAEIRRNLEALSTGSHKLVSREELERLIDERIHSAERANLVRESIRRWLSSDTPNTATTEEK